MDICELCGETFYSSKGYDICYSCFSMQQYETKGMSETDKKVLKEKRGVAKFFGGKALKGSVKQKKWAEDLRSKYLSACSDNESVTIYINEDYFLKADFWINNRENKILEKDILLLLEVTKEMNGGNISRKKVRSDLISKLRIKED